MATGKQNRISSELDRLDHVPEGFAFDQSKAWTMISTKRNSKSKKRLMLYAAVLVPFMAAIGWMLIGFEKNPADGVVVKPQIKNEPEKQLNSPAKENDVAQIDWPLQNTIKTPALNRKQQTKAASQKIGEPPVDNKPAMDFSENQIARASSGDTVTIAVAPKPKYKFRIAHINEINDLPVQPSNNIAQQSLKKPFLASVTTLRATDETKVVQKKKYPLSFLSNPIQ